MYGSSYGAITRSGNTWTINWNQVGQHGGTWFYQSGYRNFRSDEEALVYAMDYNNRNNSWTYTEYGSHEKTISAYTFYKQVLTRIQDSPYPPSVDLILRYAESVYKNLIDPLISKFAYSDLDMDLLKKIESFIKDYGDGNKFIDDVSKSEYKDLKRDDLFGSPHPWSLPTNIHLVAYYIFDTNYSYEVKNTLYRSRFIEDTDHGAPYWVFEFPVIGGTMKISVFYNVWTML
jgi:hypothetical protein